MQYRLESRTKVKRHLPGVGTFYTFIHSDQGLGFSFEILELTGLLELPAGPRVVYSLLKGAAQLRIEGYLDPVKMVLKGKTHTVVEGRAHSLQRLEDRKAYLTVQTFPSQVSAPKTK